MSSHSLNSRLEHNIVACTQRNIVYLSGKGWYFLPVLIVVCAIGIPWYFHRRARRNRPSYTVRIGLNSTVSNNNTTTINDVPPEEVKPAADAVACAHTATPIPIAAAVPIAVAEPATAADHYQDTTPVATAVPVTDTNVML